MTTMPGPAVCHRDGPSKLDLKARPDCGPISGLPLRLPVASLTRSRASGREFRPGPLFVGARVRAGRRARRGRRDRHAELEAADRLRPDSVTIAVHLPSSQASSKTLVLFVEQNRNSSSQGHLTSCDSMTHQDARTCSRSRCMFPSGNPAAAGGPECVLASNQFVFSHQSFFTCNTRTKGPLLTTSKLSTYRRWNV